MSSKALQAYINLQFTWIWLILKKWWRICSKDKFHDMVQARIPQLTGFHAFEQQCGMEQQYQLESLCYRENVIVGRSSQGRGGIDDYDCCFDKHFPWRFMRIICNKSKVLFMSQKQISKEVYVYLKRYMLEVKNVMVQCYNHACGIFVHS